MKALMTLAAAAVMLTGCAGADIERTARYTDETQATTDMNNASLKLEVEKIKTLRDIEIARITAQNKIDLKELTLKASGNGSVDKKRPSIDKCISHKDDDPELYQWCLELEIENSDAGSVTCGGGHTVSGNYNNIVIGSGRQEVNSGEKKENSITAALISGINKNPFAPIPKQPPPVDQYGPLLKLGETVVKTGAMLFGANMLFDVLQTGAAKDSVSIKGDYVSNSNNPTTSTEYAPPGEP